MKSRSEDIIIKGSDSIAKRMELNVKRQTLLSVEIYKHFTKDNMTSRYQQRVINMFKMVGKNKLMSLGQAISYYDNLKPIKETRSKIID